MMQYASPLLALHMSNMRMPLREVQHNVRAQGRALLLAWTLGLLLDLSGILPFRFMDHATTCLSLYMTSRWVKEPLPTFHASVSCIFSEQVLLLANAVVACQLEGVSEAATVISFVEITLCLITLWRVISFWQMTRTGGSHEGLLILTSITEATASITRVAGVCTGSQQLMVIERELSAISRIIRQALLPLAVASFVCEFFSQHYHRKLLEARKNATGLPHEHPRRSLHSAPDQPARPLPLHASVRKDVPTSLSDLEAPERASASFTPQQTSMSPQAKQERAHARRKEPVALLVGSEKGKRTSRDRRRESSTKNSGRSSFQQNGQRETGSTVAVAPGSTAGPAPNDVSTERARAYMVILRRMQKHFVEIGTHVAHDLKNPLNAVQLMSEAVRTTLAQQGANPALVKNATTVSTCIVQIIAMVNMLRDNLKLLSGEENCFPGEPCNVSTCLVRAFSSLDPIYNSSGVKMELECEDDVKGVVDEDRLHHVLITLLSSASRHAVRQRVLVSLAQEGDYAAIVLQDRAWGFKDEVLKRFDQPALQMDLEHPQSVLSMGLTSVKRIAEQMHCQLILSNAEPDSKRKAATVKLLIPRK